MKSDEMNSNDVLTLNPENAGAFISGDEDVWRRIVEENGQWLFSLCIRFLKKADEAEDIVQETFIQAFRMRNQLKEFQKLRGWLKIICVRLCYHLSKKPHYISMEETENIFFAKESERPDRSASSKEELKKVLEGLSSLSPRQRICLVLFVFEDMSIAEIAQDLDISQGAVKRYIFDARQSLKKIIGEEGE